MANLGSLIYQVGADTSKLKHAEREVKDSSKVMATSMSGIGVALKGALGAAGLALGLSQMKSALMDVVNTGIQVKRLDQAFTSITGSISGSRDEMEFLRKTADKLGQDFMSVAEGYKTIAAAAKGTSLEGKGVRDIFQAIMQEGTRLSLSNEQVQGSLYAISQMISKGVVSMEEMRQQLGERLPGAFQKAASAMGMTTRQFDKLASSGELLTEDFIPKFAAELMKTKESAESAEAPINRLSNAWRDLKLTLARGAVGEVTIKGLESITAVLKQLDDTIKAYEKWWRDNQSKFEITEKQSPFPPLRVSDEDVEWLKNLEDGSKEYQALKGYVYEFTGKIKEATQATKDLLYGTEQIGLTWGKLKEIDAKSTLGLGGAGGTTGRDVGVKKMTAAEQEWWDNYWAGIAKTAAKLRSDLIPALEEYKQKLGELEKLHDLKAISDELYKQQKQALEVKYVIEPTIDLLDSQIQKERAKTELMKEQVQIQGKLYKGVDDNLASMAKWVADYYGINRDLAAALIKVESSWDPGARSPKGAMGLTQVMPKTWEKDVQKLVPGGLQNPWDPFQNMMGGFAYLVSMIKMFGTLEKALAAYNTGPETVRTKGITSAGQEYIDLINKAMGGGSAIGQADKASQVRIAGLQKELELVKQRQALEIQAAEYSGKSADEIAAIRNKHQAELMGYETELSRVQRESAEEHKQLTLDKVQAEIAAYEQILGSGTLTQEQYQKVYEEYHKRRLVLIEYEKQQAIKAGVDEGLAREAALKKEEALRKEQASKQARGGAELAQVIQDYAKLAGTQQQVYESEMMMIAAKWREMEANTALDIPGLKEAYRQLYAEQMRIADVMAHGSFADGFIEGLREIAREMKTVGELGKEVAKTIASAFGTFISDLLKGQKTVKEAFRDMLDTIIGKLADLFAENLVQQLAKALTGGGKAGGGGGGLGGILGGLIPGLGGGGKGTGLAGMLGAGMTGVATMNVQAGIVNLTGAGAGGLGGLLGGAGGGATGGTCPLPGTGGGGGG